MLVWILLGTNGLAIITTLCAVKSFGKWAKQLLVLNNSNRILIQEIREAKLGVARDDSFNHAQQHTAIFVNLDEPPPEEKSA